MAGGNPSAFRRSLFRRGFNNFSYFNKSFQEFTAHRKEIIVRTEIDDLPLQFN
jgi:hypothetical protein